MESLIGIEAVQYAFQEMEAEKSLEQIVVQAQEILELTSDDKVYVEENDMRSLLQSDDTLLIEDAHSVGRGFILMIRYKAIFFIHHSETRWWSPS